MFRYKSHVLVFVLFGTLSGLNAEPKYEGELESSSKTVGAKLNPLDNSELATSQYGKKQDNLQQADDKCEENSWCWNGGTCTNGKCKCLPGTSGPFCEKVEGCENEEEQTRMCGNPDNVYCVYNATSQKPYCRCKDVMLVYDKHYKTCKECDCGADLTGNHPCKFVDGKKSCTCNNGYGVMIKDGKEEYCEYCFCGIYSDGCKMLGYGKTICNCMPGYTQYFSRCSECDCGSHGNCTFNLMVPQCSCEKGYIEKDGKCEACDCGTKGACVWDDSTGDKTCNCNSGYGIKNGICEECDCFLDDERINCTFPQGKRECSCPDGYEEQKTNCVDIDECKNETACPPYSDCKNLPGSYECTCNDGFRPIRETGNVTESPDVNKEQPEKKDFISKLLECEDINECVEYSVCTHNDTTECINTPGSYTCACKDGFEPLPNEKNGEKGCKKVEKKSWTVLYVVLGVVFGVILVGGIAFVVRRKYRS